jgi:hypothetical protein
MLGRGKDVATQFATTWKQVPDLALRLYDASGPELVEIAPESREGRELLAINASLNRKATSAEDLINPAELAKWRKNLGLEEAEKFPGDPPFLRVKRSEQSFLDFFGNAHQK